MDIWITRICKKKNVQKENHMAWHLKIFHAWKHIPANEKCNHLMPGMRNFQKSSYIPSYMRSLKQDTNLNKLCHFWLRWRKKLLNWLYSSWNLMRLQAAKNLLCRLFNYCVMCILAEMTFTPSWFQQFFNKSIRTERKCLSTFDSSCTSIFWSISMSFF